jgi:2,3-bisphosphoglycerate-independent phosphoglycerate mutase
MIGTEEKVDNINKKSSHKFKLTHIFKRIRRNKNKKFVKSNTKQLIDNNINNTNMASTPSGKRVLLTILDGWGIGQKGKGDAVYNANTPYYDYLLKTYPNSHLVASGEKVGLPAGQMGNSEVGHINIGAGRVVYQDLVKINIACREGTIAQNAAFVKCLDYVKKTGKKLHFLGLVSDGGIHSSQDHLYKMLEICQKEGINTCIVHAFTDGRDCDPKSGKGFIKALLDVCDKYDAKVASVVGRYYAMDRDNRWERVAQAYNLIVKGEGKQSADLVQAVQESYDDGVTDEFIKPIHNANVQGNLEEGDAVIFFNFRNDRAKELTIAFTQRDIPEQNLKTIPNLQYFTMTPYDPDFKGLNILFDKENVNNTMGEYISNLGYKQLRIAETEKFPHVTFFYSGGRTEPFPNEDRILIPSPKVATYDLKPEMSIYEITENLEAALKKEEYALIVLNYANGDMVGHTGVYDAIEKAVMAVDDCLSKIVETAKAHDYEVVIIADHGNCDNAINPDDTPNTQHSTNEVPFFYITDKKNVKISPGRLSDVAPTLCKILGIEVPKEMTGKQLIEF